MAVMHFTDNEKKLLLKIARMSIQNFIEADLLDKESESKSGILTKSLDKKQRSDLAINLTESLGKRQRSDLAIAPARLPAKLKQNHATFVTLTKNNELRGCIGHLEAFQPLYKDVMDNAIAAAVYDNRFPQLQKHELEKIKIEISILSKPEKIKYKNTKDLLDNITAKQDGIIIKYKNHSATFLPQVWKHFPKKQDFLSQLCIKAGLLPDFWQTSNLTESPGKRQRSDLAISIITSLLGILPEICKYQVVSFEEDYFG